MFSFLQYQARRSTTISLSTSSKASGLDSALDQLACRHERSTHNPHPFNKARNSIKKPSSNPTCNIAPLELIRLPRTIHEQLTNGPSCASFHTRFHFHQPSFIIPNNQPISIFFPARIFLFSNSSFDYHIFAFQPLTHPAIMIIIIKGARHLHVSYKRDILPSRRMDGRPDGCPFYLRFIFHFS